MTLRSVLTPAVALFVALTSSAMARAGSIDVYTFETPQFTNGELTPIGPTAPNIGDPSFTTSFADSGDPGGAEIGDGFPSPLFSGQFLYDDVGGYITLTFNDPVYYINVAFGLDASAFDPVAFLALASDPSDFVTGDFLTGQFNTDPGGPFAGGVLTYSSATPFTSLMLGGYEFPAEVGAVPFAIDNLTLSTSPIPEPSFLPLLGAGLAGLVVLRRRLKSRAV